MQTPTRSLRGCIADTPGIRPPLSDRAIARREAILRAATTLMADFATNSFSLAQFAIAIEISAATIRRHFIDMDGILTEILSRHLLAIAAALGQTARDAPDLPSAYRAAYLAATRTPLGGLTQAHLLFTRDRFSLPPEDRARLEAIHLSLGEQLGGLSPQDVLSLLDSPILEPREIEDLIAARAARAARATEAITATGHIRAATAPPERPLMVQPTPPAPAPIRMPQPPTDDWMPSPSLYDQYRESAQARAGP
jgi:AcrR family transcriptional regulator